MTRKTWPMRARIRDEGSGPARVDIYDDIGAGGWFSEGYTPSSFADAIKGVSGPLDIHINSAGGDVSDGIAIASAIRNYPGKKRTVVDGLAASIASVIAQAGDERVVEPGAMLMIHDPFTGVTGNADELRKTAETLDKHGDNLAAQYAAKAGGTPGEWRDVMKQERWYTADDAVTAGLADRVGSEAARLPQGVDLEALAASAPGRVMAALRTLPVAPAAAMAPGTCKTCKGKGKLKHAVRGGDGPMCPSCEGTGTYPPGGGGGAQDRAADAGKPKGKPYKPKPYSREAWEDTQCPVCQKFNDQDSSYCGQCGTKLAGRTDVKEVPQPGGKPAAGLTGDDVRAILREEVARAASRLPVRDAIPGAVKRAFKKQVKKDPTSDLGAAVHRLSEWAASGSYPTGCSHADLKWMYDQICAELQDRDPDSDAGGNFPSAPSGSARHGAARVMDCKALTDALAAIAKAAGGKDAGGKDVSGRSLEQVRAALKGAR